MPPPPLLLVTGVSLISAVNSGLAPSQGFCKIPMMSEALREKAGKLLDRYFPTEDLEKTGTFRCF